MEITGIALASVSWGAMIILLLINQINKYYDKCKSKRKEI